MEGNFFPIPEGSLIQRLNLMAIRDQLNHTVLPILPFVEVYIQTAVTVWFMQGNLSACLYARAPW